LLTAKRSPFTAPYSTLDVSTSTSTSTSTGADADADADAIG